MQIINIKKLKKNKYKITFEDKVLIVFEDILIKYNILSNKNIDEKTLKEIEKDNNYYEIYEASLKYLDIKMRLETELRNYLKNKYDEITINKIIERLKKEEYIDDSKYVKAYINDKMNLSSDGPYKIKRDLEQKGVDESLINIDIDENIIKEKLKKLIIKYSNINKNNSINVIKTKTLNHFNQLGYDRELILEVIDSISIKGDPNKIKKEYDKLINKYSKKYSGYKLESTIKQKLYQRGYSTEEIDKIKGTIN